MKILIPHNKKIRQIYAYLVLKAIQNKQPYVTYEDVRDAIAIANVTPNKYQIKKYLLILSSHEPPLLKPLKPSIFTIIYKIFFYAFDENDKSSEIQEVTLGEAMQFKKDLILVLSNEPTENTLTYAEALKQKMLEEDAYEGA